MEEKVLRLDEHSVSLLRSGVYLFSFTHALKSLLEVAISSNATIISCSIDSATSTLRVDDDGVGMDTALVNLFGRFDSNALVSTSSTNRSSPGKGISSYLSLSQHRVMDSLAHLSLLDICTRQEGASHTHQTLFRDGQVIFSAPARTSRRHSRGTTTTVRDLFHNLPVRQIRESDPTRHQQRLKRQWEEARLAIQSLAIVYPHITFVLRDSSHPSLAAPNSSDSFYRISKTGLSSSTFGKIYGQQLVQDSIPLDVSIDGFQVTGLFSKKRHTSRAIQLIYLDRVLLASNILVHKILARLFAGPLSPDASASPHSSQSAKVQPAIRNGASSLDLHPVYLLLYTSLSNPSASTHEPDVKFLDEKEQYLTPQIEEQMSKIASRIFNQVFPPLKDGPSSSSGETILRQCSLVKRTLQSHWPVTKRPHLCNPSAPASSNARPPISLTDRFPAPRKNHFDRSVVRSVEGKPSASQFNSRTEAHQIKRGKLTDRLAHAPTKPSPTITIPAQAPSLDSMILDLRSRFEYKTPKSSNSSQKADRKVDSDQSHAAVSFQLQGGKKHKLDGVVTTNSEENTFRIDLAQLANPSNFAVVGQLDMKFLIVMMSDQSRANPDLIVAFDQHAVHERIRIERFLQEMCSGNANVQELKLRADHQEERAHTQRGHHHDEEKYVPILVNRIEFDGLSKFKKVFTRWGFIYELTLKKGSKPVDQSPEDENEDSDEDGFQQIFMRAVPELIWQRVRCNDGQYDMLKEVLRGCLGFFEDRFRDQNLALLHHQSFSADPQRDWFASVKDCPSVLIHLLNSKACRGSIMFGDKLSNKESQKLLSELGRTKLPFSCAHGRPTCHPLFRFAASEHPPATESSLAPDLPLPPSRDSYSSFISPPPEEPVASHSDLIQPHSSFKPPSRFLHQRKIHWESLFSH